MLSLDRAELGREGIVWRDFTGYVTEAGLRVCEEYKARWTQNKLLRDYNGGNIQ
jgi:hypothetical protein